MSNPYVLVFPGQGAQAVGMGKSKPIVSVAGTVEQQGMNRRVEIKVRPKK